MARRSAQNQRYRKDAQVGSTRRSASSAKPKREAGESGGSGGKGGGKGSSSAGKGRSSVPLEPQTPEFKRWRKLWLWMLGGTLGMVAATTGLRAIGGDIANGASFAALVGAYLLLGVGLWIDWTKLRPMRKEFRESIASGGKGKPKQPSKSDKAEKADKAAKAAKAGTCEDTKGDE